MPVFSQALLIFCQHRDKRPRQLDILSWALSLSPDRPNCQPSGCKNKSGLSTGSPPMPARRLILASASEIRRQLLANAGLNVEAVPARIDEDAIRAALDSEGASPRDIADTLAEMKARKLAERNPDAMVIGCDQVLEFQRKAWGKPDTPAIARDQLRALRGQTHRLLSAVVVYDGGKPVWRHVGEVRLTMHAFSDAYLDEYLARNWDSIRQSVGGYKLEEEGVRLFSAIEGDYFTVLGLPVLPLLSYLGQRGAIAI
jgi:septum formation protein